MAPLLAFVLGLLLVVAHPADAQGTPGDTHAANSCPATNTTGHVVSGAWEQPPDAKNYFNPQNYTGLGTDPCWVAKLANTATNVNITTAVEFGWSVLASPNKWQATLDVSPPTPARVGAPSTVDVTLTLSTLTSGATYGNPAGFIVAAVSAAFVGTTLELLPGNTLLAQPISTQFDPATGNLTVAFPLISVSGTNVLMVQSITWRLRGPPVPPPPALEVASLFIGPPESHRHVHEYAPITALALDAAGNPVAGAVVTFSVYTGDSHGSYDVHSEHANVGQRSVTTDAQGRARVDIPSRHPDAVTVVASVRNPSGTTVVSRPAHIVWTDDDYEREEEEHYYSRRHRNAEEYDDAE